MMLAFSIHGSPLLPEWCLALVGLVLIAAWALGCVTLSRKQIRTRSILTLAVLRGLAIVLFMLCLWQPVISYERRVPSKPELLVLVDTSRSMGLPYSPTVTRLQHALEELNHSGLMSQFARHYQTHWFTFDRQAHPIDAGELSSAQAEGESTQYARSLRSAVDLLSAQAASPLTTPGVQRVLLVSDGQDHGQEDLVDAAQQMGVAVDVIAAAAGETPGPARAASIENVQAARRVLLGSETPFLVTIDPGTAKTGEMLLVLEENGREVKTQSVSLDPRQGQQQVKISYRPTARGIKHYDFLLRPKQAAKTPDDAQRYGLSVQVLDDRIEVLALEDRWRWEFKYMRRVLEDDPSFNFTAMLSRGGKTYVQFGEPDRRVDLAGFPQSRAELDWFDVIVLGDVDPAHWPHGLSAAIADAVVDGGKSLVLVAGPTIPQVAQVPELNAILPVELSNESGTPLKGPVALRITPEGARSPIFSGGRAATEKLPDVDSVYPPVRKRPAATVLVQTAKIANAAGPIAVIAEQPVGRGHVLYVGTDTLWKWQMLSPLDEHDKTIYDRFWQQAFRSLTPPRTAARSNLWLLSDRSRYEVGSHAALRAELSAKNADDDVKLEASVELPSGRRVPLGFTPDPVAAGAFLSQFDATMTGNYHVSASARVNGQLVGEASLSLEVTADHAELKDTAVDRPRLARIAARTGGKFIDPADPQTWPNVSAAAPPMVQETQNSNLLENFSLIVLLCGVLGSDWLLRLLRGLV